MGETTGISWTDHTFNPWIGCTKVSQGCKLCYAETQNNRYGWNPAGWGVGAPRHRTSAENWRKPLAWARAAVKDGVTRRVFCASLADVFDPEAPDEWRAELWQLIGACSLIGGLEWLLLTKRPENIGKMLPNQWCANPPEFLRIGVTVENQENEWRVGEMFKAWSGKNFISVEPMLGPVEFSHDHMTGEYKGEPISVVGGGSYHRIVYSPRIQWVICGGESGRGCRPMDIEWARNLAGNCDRWGVKFFMKQLGGNPDKRHDLSDFPEDLRVREFPEVK